MSTAAYGVKRKYVQYAFEDKSYKSQYNKILTVNVKVERRKGLSIFSFQPTAIRTQELKHKIRISLVER